MNIQKIVGFGDSWMYGDELLDPLLVAQNPDTYCASQQNESYRNKHSFLGQLAAHYNVNFENFGVPGGSFQSMIWTFLWWLRHETMPERCLVLCCLTESARASFFRPDFVGHGNHPSWNKFVHSTWVNIGSQAVPEEYHDLVKRYIALTHCEQLSVYNYQQAVTLFDACAVRYGFPLLQFHTAKPPLDIHLPTMIWPDFTLIRFFDDHPGNQDRQWLKACDHPNERGHEIIRDLLIPEIDRVILNR
jgi:hypothetical protein